jgi:hypothetical protein
MFVDEAATTTVAGPEGGGGVVGVPLPPHAASTKHIERIATIRYMIPPTK